MRNVASKSIGYTYIVRPLRNLRYKTLNQEAGRTHLSNLSDTSATRILRLIKRTRLYIYHWKIFSLFRDGWMRRNSVYWMNSFSSTIARSVTLFDIINVDPWNDRISNCLRASIKLIKRTNDRQHDLTSWYVDCDCFTISNIRVHTYF